MGIFKDHEIVKTLKDGNLRNDPEVLELVCEVITNFEADVDKLGGIEVSMKTDESLEMLNAAVDRVENEYDKEEEEEELEEIDFDEDEDIEEEELDEDEAEGT